MGGRVHHKTRPRKVVIVTPQATRHVFASDRPRRTEDSLDTTSRHLNFFQLELKYQSKH